MLRSICFVLVLTILTSLAAVSCTQKPATPKPGVVSTPTPQKVYELRWSSFMPAGHHLHVNAANPWGKKLEELSGGRIHYTLYPGEALGKGAEQYNLVAKGLADGTIAITTFTADRFPLSGVFELPFLIPNQFIGTEILAALLDEYLRREYEDVHLLGIVMSGPFVIMTTNKPVRKLEDIKGLKIRSPGLVTSETLSALGAVPVTLTGAEQYEALQKGTIEGTVFGYASGAAYKLKEVCKYVTEIGMGLYVIALPINKAFYERLPDDLKYIVDYSGQMMVKGKSSIPQSYWITDVLAKEDMTKAGTQIIMLTQEENSRFLRAVMPVWEKYTKELDRRGVAATKLLNAIKAELVKWNIMVP